MFVPFYQQIKELVARSGLSLRRLAELSSVRRQSIMNFLAGGNISIANLEKVIAALGYDLELIPHKSEQKRAYLKERLKVSAEKIKSFCEANDITSLAFFGSILRADFNKESDIDIIIATSQTMTIFELTGLEEKFQGLFKTKRKIDIFTKKSLSPLISKEIADEIEVFYEKAA